MVFFFKTSITTTRPGIYSFHKEPAVQVTQLLVLQNVLLELMEKRTGEKNSKGVPNNIEQ